MKTRLFILVSILALASASAAYSQQLFDRITMTVMAVSNMDRAKAFYTKDLGFTVVKDYSGGGFRWVTVAPPGGGLDLTLSTYFGSLKPGAMQSYLSTADVRSAYSELKAEGVEVSKIKNDLYGPGSGVKWFSFRDPDGNQWLIWQEPRR